jgi:SAM-dependent methyltransferase
MRAPLDASAPEGILLPPPGAHSVPPFQEGWIEAGGAPVGAAQIGADPPARREAFLAYVERPSVNWSEELEDLHEQSSREHFLDAWTRRAMLRWLGPLPDRPVLADVGCSTGHLLADLRAAHPEATLIGVDLVASGLRKANALVPQARLVQADVCELPLRPGALDAVLSANLLEHVPDDVGALAELRRVLRPGARAVVVVPAGPATYDYYDRFLGHERRYGRGELAGKARRVGLEALLDVHLGFLPYPLFWLVKQRNRRRFGHLEGEALAGRVAGDIAATKDSRLGALACRLEALMLDAGVRPRFGIRGLTVLRRPEDPR